MVAAGADDKVYVDSKLIVEQEKGQVCLPALSDRYMCITGQNNYVRRFHCKEIKLEKN